MEVEKFFGSSYSGSKGFTQHNVVTANATGFGAAADEHFHVSHSLFLCGQGHITLNQQPIIGTGYTHTLPDDRFTSSVFVALAETWIKIVPPQPKI